jgi:hypothetical protein
MAPPRVRKAIAVRIGMGIADMFAIVYLNENEPKLV